MSEKLFYLSGLPMFIWYIGLRWTWLGNELGKTTDTVFKLNWWFAPINFLTAILSAFFLTITLMDFSYSFKFKVIFWIAGAVCARNVWYAGEDIFDYLFEPSKEQFIYIIIDIIMIINTGCWIYIYKGMK